MTIPRVDSSHLRALRWALHGVLALGVVALVGCASGERERYMSARSTTVVPQAGDGSAYLSVWPETREARQAAAEASRARQGE